MYPSPLNVCSDAAPDGSQSFAAVFCSTVPVPVAVTVALTRSVHTTLLASAATPAGDVREKQTRAAITPAQLSTTRDLGNFMYGLVGARKVPPELCAPNSTISP